MHPIKAALFILFAPARFERVALEYALRYEARENSQLRDLLARGAELPQDIFGGLAAGTHQQVKALRRIAKEGFILCLLTIVAGYAVGYAVALAFGAPPKWTLYGLQVVGASAILGASIGSGNMADIETFDGNSLPERVHDAFFRGLAALGTFVFVVSVGWDSL